MRGSSVIAAALLAATTACATYELPIDYWKTQYSDCYDTFPIMILGNVLRLRPLEFSDGGKGHGYTKFSVSVETDTVLKGHADGPFEYTVWLEGKKGEIPKIQGAALLCLSISPDGSIVDKDGFGRLPVNSELKDYAFSLLR